MNFFKWLKKDIVLNCYTSDASVFNFAPIKPSAHFLPEWWKEIPQAIDLENSIIPIPTMKHCTGFTDLYKQGFVIPMWCDFLLVLGQKGTTDFLYQFSDGKSAATPHPAVQRGAAFPKLEFQHLKIVSPWLITCDEPIEFLATNPTWNQKDPSTMTVLPGVVNFKYQFGTSMNTIWKRPAEQTKYQIDFGTPLYHYVPLTERKVRIKTHLISQQDFDQLGSSATAVTFFSKYKSVKRTMQKSGCPFHFKAEK